jgi:CBS domain-containing protein
MHARDVMTRNFAFCTPDTSLRAVAQLMRDEDCGCLLIKVGDYSRNLLGMVTDGDLVCRALAKDLDPAITPVAIVMNSRVESIHENASEEACLQRMDDKQVRRLAVIDSHGHCCGIITLGDVARRRPQEKTGDVARRGSPFDSARLPVRVLSSTNAAGMTESNDDR